jgi:GDP-mannose 6-dehydrogenase
VRVSIFGIGYVGAVTAGCLSAARHRVVCVDTNQNKVDVINAGECPIVEPGLSDLLQEAVQQQRITATIDAELAVQQTDISIICVGTPSLPSGRLNLTYASTVYRQIVDALEIQKKSHIIIIRSTMLPGSVRDVAQYKAHLLEELRIEVCFCPEFLREGTAVRDYSNPALSAYGTLSGTRCPDLEELMAGPALMSLESAELLKYACNYWHAVKVAFGNEIGRLSMFLGEDGIQLMQKFCEDSKLNISSHYLRPGAPYGGSCLPKDVSALSSFVRQEGLNLPLLESLSQSNDAHTDHLLKQIINSGASRVLIIGLSFKKNTDDLRGSPMVTVAETLLGKGIEVRIFDPNLKVTSLTGSNLSEIERRMPHLASRLSNDLVRDAETTELLLVSQDIVDSTTLNSVISAQHRIIDLVGIAALRNSSGQYSGICW